MGYTKKKFELHSVRIDDCYTCFDKHGNVLCGVDYEQYMELMSDEFATN